MLLNRLAVMEDQLKQLVQGQNNLTILVNALRQGQQRDREEEQQLSVPDGVHLPLSSTQDLLALEEKLRSVDVAKQLVIYLTTVNFLADIAFRSAYM